MLKHSDLIEKLDTEQKFRLLTDLRRWSKSPVEDFPSIKTVSVDNIKKDGKVLPSINTCANTWDDSLTEEYFSMVGGLAKKEGDSVVVCQQNSFVDMSINSNKISEDEVLTGNMMNSFVNGMSYNGITPVVGNLCITDSELPYFDNEFNERFIRDSYLKPYQKLVENENDFFILCDNLCKTSNYGNPNRNLLPCIVKDELNFKNFFVSSDYNRNNFQSKNFISFKNILRNDEILSEEELDELLDQLLDVIIKDEDQFTDELSDEQINDVIYRVYLNSLVLLKNDNLLPVKYKYDVGVVSDVNYGKVDPRKFTNRYHNCNTIEFITYKSNVVKELVNKDLVVIFLRTKNGHVFDEDSLLIKKLHNMAKNIIGVITTSDCIDTSFDRECDALIKINDKSMNAVYSLFDVIYGKFCPCGKTTISYPYNIQRAENLYNSEKQTKHLIGECTGYGFYDKIGEKVKYPFGHGLSYADFKFDQFNCSKEEISFTVKNNGIYNASEIVQVYLGIENSFVPRAEKKLYSYIKVTLKPNEEKKYTVKFTKDAFTKYDAVNKTYAYEKGIYSIYVNTSLDDVKLRGRILVDGNEFLALKGERGIRAVKHSVKNVDDNKKERITSDKIKKNTVFSLIIVNACLAIILALLNKYIEVTVITAISSVVVLTDIIALILYKSDKGKYIKKQKGGSQSIVANIDLEDLFKENEVKENFQESIVATSASEIEEVKQVDIQYFDNDKINKMFEELSELITSNGLVVSADHLKLLLACISSSKIVMVKSNNQELFMRLVKVLNKYFGNQDIVNCYVRDNPSEYGIFKQNEEETNDLYKNIVYASRNDSKMCFLPFTGVNGSNINYYSELISNVNFESKKTVINVNDKSLVVPKNIWYLFSFNEMKDIFTLPNNLLTKSTVLQLEIAECEPSGTTPEFNPLSIYSFDYLIKNIRNNNCIEEDDYKKFDMLFEYVNKYSPMNVGNKLNISFEDITSVLLMFKKSEIETIDGLITIKILPIIFSLLNGKIKDSDDGLYAEFDRLFGAENLELSMKVLDSINSKVAL